MKKKLWDRQFCLLGQLQPSRFFCLDALPGILTNGVHLGGLLRYLGSLVIVRCSAMLFKLYREALVIIRRSPRVG